MPATTLAVDVVSYEECAALPESLEATTSTPRATFERAHHRVARLRRQVAVAAFAVRSQREHVSLP